MASARMKNWKWYYRITVSTEGKVRYLERGSYGTKEEALLAGEKHELRLKSEEFVEKRISYGDLCDEWLEIYAPTLYKLNTIKSHKKVLKSYILPVLKTYDVSCIDTRDLQEIINNETPRHTLDGLYKIKATMSKTFDYAVKAGYASRNPLEGVNLPRRRSIGAQALKSTRTQETCSKELVEAIFERFPEGHPCYIPLLLGYRCGLRLGEVYGLLIEDFDRRNKTLTIRRQIQFNDDNKLYFTDPKYCDPGEYRVIDLDGDTCKKLTRHIEKIEALRPIMRHKQYWMDENGIVNTEKNGKPIYFINVRYEDGSYISPRTMQHVSRVIHGKDSKFDKINLNWDFHILRHTHASECIAAGMPPESVRNRLGHRHLTTTYRFYVHETEDQNAKAKSILEAMYA